MNTPTSSARHRYPRAVTTLASLALALPLLATAQTKSASDGIAEYRKMLEDGNPAELFEAKGESLWKQARGPKKATLEKCDLGLGPGVVKGAWVQLPRYFADTGKVQDVESRLVSCMASLQGFNADELVKTPFGRGEMANITAAVQVGSAGLLGISPLPHGGLANSSAL
jgi:sulfur-oxidizing protein SoxA